MKAHKQVVFLFSGQGTQYFQMGRDLYTRNPRFHHWMDLADRVFSDLAGESLIRRIYDPARKMSEPFNQTRFTSPAIFMMSYALTQTLMEAGIQPDLLLGASLGEIIASCIAGAMTLGEGLTTVVRQAQILGERDGSGGMLVILAPVELFHSTALLREKTTLASINHPNCFVVSGLTRELAEVTDHLKAQRIIVSPLPVSQAFHSPLIDWAKTPSLESSAGLSYRPPKTPIVSCLTGTRLPEIQGSHLWNCIRGPMDIQKSIQGLESEGPQTYIDVGPAGSFATMVKSNLAPDSRSEIHTAINPFNPRKALFDEKGDLRVEAVAGS